jgi:hypothetical protein
MPYYTSARGDYYRGRGDFWSKAKKAVKKAAKVVTTINPALGGGFSKVNAMQGSALASFMPGLGGAMPGGSLVSGLGGMLGEKFGIGAATGASIATALVGGGPTLPGDSPIIPDILEIPLERAGLNEMRGVKRRSMNAANVSALRRALRRVDSFRNLAKKSGALPAAKRLPAQRTSRACCK